MSCPLGAATIAKPNNNVQIPDPEAIEAIELPLLLEAMVQRYGYDFRDYAVEQFGVVRSLGSHLNTVRIGLNSLFLNVSSN